MELEITNKTQEKDQKAELILLLELDKLTSQGAKREFCANLDIEWEEYLHLKRKYRFVMERYKKEKENDYGFTIDP